MTFISELEEITEEVSDWAVDIIQDVVKALMPDGKPWGYVALSDEDQIQNYLALRGQPEAWIRFIGEQAAEITNKLTDAGLPPDKIAEAHPFDIASKFAIAYSSEMERELRKRSGLQAASSTTSQ